ncbi:hypothetical protein STCU_07828 [Strigomonas culicis]|uniref:Oxidoreductase FAD/NAD(P)-binding domain-containing protein n=1 Tax=Strigomonas culicis TaxID=28005 RepID=S9TXH5_9TRYP|nr:hypothetical protein STCU_07828 [Strigomonas culicis]|eukprot:EPY23182.1 hypothetical protein STCU_07828 [Strigomonas culicis]
MRPGDAVEMKACGGLQVDLRPQTKQIRFRSAIIKKFGLIAGGSGIAPMLQLIRAALNPPYSDSFETIRLIYAAEDERELTYKHLLRSYQRQTPDKFTCDFVLNNPPEGWTEGVGYIDKAVLQHALPPPSKDLLIAICGPPVMQRSAKRYLHELGYSDKLVHTVDEGMVY